MNYQEIDEVICGILSGKHPSWPADWSEVHQIEFLNRACYHGVPAILSGFLNSSKSEGFWPHRILDFLAARARAEAAYDMFRANWVGRLFQAMSENKLRFIVIKGAAVSQLCYQYSYYRSRSDTDIFIHPSDIERVRQIFESLGVVSRPPFFKSHQFTGLVGTESSAPIIFDIHWRVSNNPRYALMFDFETAWNRSVQLAGGNSCQFLNSVDSLLLACAHRWGNAKHDPNKLIWLWDVHLLATNFSAGDWQEFTRIGVAKNLEDVCLDGLENSKRCYDTKIPEETFTRLSAERGTRLNAHKFVGSNLALLIDDLRQLPDLSSRCELLRELLFPNPNLLQSEFSESRRSLLPWLYLKRIVNGVRDGFFAK